MDFVIGNKETQTYFKLFFKVTIRNNLTKNYSVVASLLSDSHFHTE